MRLTRHAFESAIREALAEIPPHFIPYMEHLVVEVEDLPQADVLSDLGIDDPTELLGLYQGTPLTERSVEDHGLMPDRVVIYQRNLESMCESQEELIAEIRATVLHEIGHHFGMDEDALDELGFG